MNGYDANQPVQQQPHTAPKSWWSRHWKWVVPVGCIVPMLGLGGLIALFVFRASNSLKSSEVYVQSLTAVRASMTVELHCGSSITPGVFVRGTIESTDDPPSGRADITYDVRGGRGRCSGTVHAVADRIDGEWTFRTIDLIGNSIDDRIDVAASLQEVRRGPASFNVLSTWREASRAGLDAAYRGPRTPGRARERVTLQSGPFAGDLGALRSLERDEMATTGMPIVPLREVQIGDVEGLRIDFEYRGTTILSIVALHEGRRYRLMCHIDPGAAAPEREDCDEILASFRVSERWSTIYAASECRPHVTRRQRSECETCASGPMQHYHQYEAAGRRCHSDRHVVVGLDPANRATGVR